MNELEKLKPCPICGGEAYVCRNELDSKQTYSISCSSCQFETRSYDNFVDLVFMWNTRYVSRKLSRGCKYYIVKKSGRIISWTFDDDDIDWWMMCMDNVFFSEEDAENHKDEMLKKYEEAGEKYIR